MKAMLNLDQDADLTTLPAEYQSKIAFRMVNGKMVAYFPKGCTFEGEHALHLVSTGQAAPIDAECAQASGMTETQLAVRQLEYRAAVAGIKGKKDHDLFMAGVITGYAEGTTDEAPIYVHGPNWDAYQKALELEKAPKASDI